jgi:hypothetical protein
LQGRLACYAVDDNLVFPSLDRSLVGLHVGRCDGILMWICAGWPIFVWCLHRKYLLGWESWLAGKGGGGEERVPESPPGPEVNPPGM